MSVPTSISDLDPDPVNNSPLGTDAIGTTLDNYIRAHGAIIRQVSDAKATTSSLAASSGSSLIGYLPAGTGAVATTVQTKLRESVSIFDFMTDAQISATQSGSPTDDSTPTFINAAATGKEIRVPEGTYLVNLKLKSDWRIKSSGIGKTIFKPYDIAKNTITTDLTASVVRIALCDCSVYADPASTTTYAVNIEAPQIASVISFVDTIYTRNLDIHYGLGFRMRGYFNTAGYGYIQNWVHDGNLITNNTYGRGVTLMGDIYESWVDKITVNSAGIADLEGIFAGLGPEALGFPRRMTIGTLAGAGNTLVSTSNAFIIHLKCVHNFTLLSADWEINTGDTTNQFFKIEHVNTTGVFMPNCNMQSAVDLSIGGTILSGNNLRIGGRMAAGNGHTIGIGVDLTSSTAVNVAINEIAYGTSVTEPSRKSAKTITLDASGGGSVVATDIANPIYIGENSTALTALAGVPDGKLITIWAQAGLATSNYFVKGGVFRLRSDFMPHTYPANIEPGFISITLRAYNPVGVTYFYEVSRTLPDFTHVSTDNGNADKTLIPGSSSTTQLWDTAITATKAVTLATGAAYNGAKFRIVRGSGATGAFNLNVGTGPLKALAAASTWCDVEYNGTAWILTAYGTL